MPELQQVDATKITRAPVLLRARVLLTLGWTLLGLSLVLLGFQVLWMWHRMGSGALIVSIGLSMDALVGLGLIIAGNRARRKQNLASF